MKAVFGGYDMAVVDEFLEQLSGDYSSLYKENAILKSKIKVLVEKVEEYRSTEDAMRMALLTAQKMGDNMVKEAKEKSEAMITDATAEAAQRLAEITQQVKEEEARLKVAKEATTAYTREAAGLTEKIASFLAAVPTLEMEKRARAPKEEPTPEEKREEEIMDAVHDIDGAVSKITEEEIPEEPAAEGEAPAEEPAPAGEAEPEAPAKPKYDDEGEYTIRPKFDFDNLRFGTNMNGEND
ncbi:MAG: DivIVA domain-containing protein [Oscillospiraceae bacterium]|nr:DivIVA domain-containing protein [Oscillospiraceae bacterium]MCR5174178.1 DivIVA domain-containing protein [Oscillospiraceae bacterium]